MYLTNAAILNPVIEKLDVFIFATPHARLQQGSHNHSKAINATMLIDASNFLTLVGFEQQLIFLEACQKARDKSEDHETLGRGGKLVSRKLVAVAFASVEK